jgi:hypothetical protein
MWTIAVVALVLAGLTWALVGLYRKGRRAAKATAAKTSVRMGAEADNTTKPDGAA